MAGGALGVKKYRFRNKIIMKLVACSEIHVKLDININIS